MSTSNRFATLALLLSLAAGCSAPKLYEHNFKVLASASESIGQGNYEQALKPLERLIVETNPEAKEYGLQRFYAALLLTRLNVNAGLSAPFLLEPPRPAAAGVRGTEAQPSWLAHMVVAIYDIAYAVQWQSGATGAKLEEDGQALLPPDLADFAPEDALSYLGFARGMIYSRLGFQDEIAESLQRQPELLDVKYFSDALERARVTPQMRPWLYWGVFEYLKSRDEPNAYKFGVLAREAGRDAGTAWEEDRSEEIVHWILDESKYVFVSSAGLTFDPGSDFCTQSGEPNVDFRAILKEDYQRSDQR